MIKPDLTLNMDEKIYLAVAQNTKNAIVFVYTLACLSKGNTNSHDLFATREVYSFNNPQIAQMYYDTIKNIVDINKSDNTKNTYFEWNRELIQRFNEHIK